eukprot:Gb_25939 [translate_table: standard]
MGTLNLANVDEGLSLVDFITAYNFYDVAHLEGSGIGFEEDKPNFFSSFYSKIKIMVEELLIEYENVCTLRV